MQTNMTSKGQVTIPRAIRQSAGLVPGRPVVVELNDRGEAVVRPAPVIEKTRDERIAEYMARVAEAQALFREQDQMPGIDADEFYLMMRGPPAEV